MAGILLMLMAISAPARSAPVQVPFDFSRSEIGVEVMIKGTPLYVLIDTGVDPSVIDRSRAEALGLEIDKGDGGEASGFGEGKGQAVFPAKIAGLTIQGRGYGPIDALASDLSALSTHYGRKLDAVLGYSFLSDKIVMIDYPRRNLAILDDAAEAAAMTGSCRTRWSTGFETVDGFPILQDFRFGTLAGPISIDTGANGGIGLYQQALDLPGLRDALVEKGAIVHNGARGSSKASAYAIAVPVGFGPFRLPAGQVASLHPIRGSAGGPIANIGNPLFAAMKVRMLLDYRARTMTFYGDCR
ncbi:MAG: aspartyl protease family protein [Pseudomonadota bacterium]